MCLKAHLRGVCSLGMSVADLPLCCPALMVGRAKEGEVSLLAAACTFSSPSGNTCTWSIDNCKGDKQPMSDTNRQQTVAVPGRYDELDGRYTKAEGLDAVQQQLCVLFLLCTALQLGLWRACIQIGVYTMLTHRRQKIKISRGGHLVYFIHEPFVGCGGGCSSCHHILLQGPH